MKYDVPISFIVPIYNIEKYLPHCLESIIEQKVDKEIIIINDGSTDNSLVVATKYIKKFPFIKIINQQNSGISAARNAGIQSAAGKYLYFVDSDDFLFGDELSNILLLCESNGLDMIRWQFMSYYEASNEYINNSLPKKSLQNEGKVFYAPEYFCHNVKIITKNVAVWAGLYKREFILQNSLFFLEGALAEDHLFALKALTISTDAKIMEINKPLYVYRRKRPGSLTTINTGIKSIISQTVIFHKMLEYVQQQSFAPKLQLCALQFIYERVIAMISISRTIPSAEMSKVYTLITSEMLSGVITYRLSWLNYKRIYRFKLRKFFWRLFNHHKNI